MPSTACLLASDSGGEVVLWVADFDATCNSGAAAGGTSASKEEDKADMQQDGTVTRGGRSAPAWEAEAQFGAETEKKGTCVGAAESAVAAGRIGGGGRGGNRRPGEGSGASDGTTNLSKDHAGTAVREE